MRNQLMSLEQAQLKAVVAKDQLKEIAEAARDKRFDRRSMQLEIVRPTLEFPSDNRRSGRSGSRSHKSILQPEFGSATIIDGFNDPDWMTIYRQVRSASSMSKEQVGTPAMDTQLTILEEGVEVKESDIFMSGIAHFRLFFDNNAGEVVLNNVEFGVAPNEHGIHILRTNPMGQHQQDQHQQNEAPVDQNSATILPFDNPLRAY